MTTTTAPVYLFEIAGERYPVVHHGEWLYVNHDFHLPGPWPGDFIRTCRINPDPTKRPPNAHQLGQIGQAQVIADGEVVLLPPDCAGPRILHLESDHDPHWFSTLPELRLRLGGVMHSGVEVVVVDEDPPAVQALRRAIDQRDEQGRQRKDRAELLGLTA